MIEGKGPEGHRSYLEEPKTADLIITCESVSDLV